MAQSKLKSSGVAPTGEPALVVWPRALLILMVIVGVPALLIWWEWYKFQDCRAVGHSLLYCVGQVIF